MRRAGLLTALFVCVAFAKTVGQSVSGEDLAAWSARNGYTGARNWQSFLLIAPGNMGPNALPVPLTLRGLVDTASSFSVSGTRHWRSGERAADLTGELRLGFGRRASLRVRYIGLEGYRTDEALTRERNSLEADGRGLAAGDVHVTAHYQLVHEHGNWPALALSVRTRTASGTRLEALRYSDGPGYAFDVSAGRSFEVANSAVSLRPYGQLGFYVWQRTGDEQPQNDAISYAGGLELTRGELVAHIELAGYSGYEAELDQPMVGRAGLQAWRERLGLSLTLQCGLRDFEYTSVGLGVNYRWPRLE